MAEGGQEETAEKVQSHLTGCRPVFVMHASLPPEGKKPFSVREICDSCEKKSGFGSILGAQRLGALWRIYPNTNDAREKLLVEGFSLRNIHITLRDTNPFVITTPKGGRVKDKYGQEKELNSTRVVIGGLPISSSNKDIEDILDSFGVNKCSQLYMERDRDEGGGLTRWLTGRRFIYIEIPRDPLPERIKLGSFTATFYHKEQKTLKANKESECKRCFQLGHKSNSCPNDIVCSNCKIAGHTRRECDVPPPPLDPNLFSDNMLPQPVTTAGDGGLLLQNSFLPLTYFDTNIDSQPPPPPPPPIPQSSYPPQPPPPPPRNDSRRSRRDSSKLSLTTTRSRSDSKRRRSKSPTNVSPRKDNKQARVEQNSCTDNEKAKEKSAIPVSADSTGKEVEHEPGVS